MRIRIPRVHITLTVDFHTPESTHGFPVACTVFIKEFKATTVDNSHRLTRVPPPLKPSLSQLSPLRVATCFSLVHYLKVRLAQPSWAGCSFFFGIVFFAVDSDGSRPTTCVSPSAPLSAHGLRCGTCCLGPLMRDFLGPARAGTGLRDLRSNPRLAVLFTMFADCSSLLVILCIPPDETRTETYGQFFRTVRKTTSYIIFWHVCSRLRCVVSYLTRTSHLWNVETYHCG